MPAANPAADKKEKENKADAGSKNGAKDKKTPSLEEEGELTLDDLKASGKGDCEWGDMSIRDLDALRPTGEEEGGWGDRSMADFNF